MNENSYRTFKTVIATLALAVATSLAFSFLSTQHQRDNEFFCNGAPITIQEGDTLYWLTRTHCDGNTMNALDAVVDFYGTTLTVGKTLYLPSHNNCELRMTDGGDIFEEC